MSNSSKSKFFVSQAHQRPTLSDIIPDYEQSIMFTPAQTYKRKYSLFSLSSRNSTQMSTYLSTNYSTKNEKREERPQISKIETPKDNFSKVSHSRTSSKEIERPSESFGSRRRQRTPKESKIKTETSLKTTDLSISKKQSTYSVSSYANSQRTQPQAMSRVSFQNSQLPKQPETRNQPSYVPKTSSSPIRKAKKSSTSSHKTGKRASIILPEDEMPKHSEIQAHSPAATSSFKPATQQKRRVIINENPGFDFKHNSNDVAIPFSKSSPKPSPLHNPPQIPLAYYDQSSSSDSLKEDSPTAIAKRFSERRYSSPEQKEPVIIQKNNSPVNDAEASSEPIVDDDYDSGDMFDPKKVIPTPEFPDGKKKQIEERPPARKLIFDNSLYEEDEEEEKHIDNNKHHDILVNKHEEEEEEEDKKLNEIHDSFDSMIKDVKDDVQVEDQNSKNEEEEDDFGKIENQFKQHLLKEEEEEKEEDIIIDAVDKEEEDEREFEPQQAKHEEPKKESAFIKMFSLRGTTRTEKRNAQAASTLENIQPTTPTKVVKNETEEEEEENNEEVVINKDEILISPLKVPGNQIEVATPIKIIEDEEEEVIDVSTKENKDVVQPISLLNEEDEEDIKSNNEDNKVIQHNSLLNEEEEENMNQSKGNRKVVQTASLLNEEDEENIKSNNGDNKVIQQVSVLNEEEEEDININQSKEDNNVIQKVSLLNEEEEEDIKINKKDNRVIKQVSITNEEDDFNVSKEDDQTKKDNKVVQLVSLINEEEEEEYMNIIKEANKVIQSISLSSEDEDDINISKEDNKVIQPVSLLNEEEEDLKSSKEDNKVIQPVSSLNENKEEDVNKIDLNTKDASSIKEEEDEENDVDIKNISWNDEEDDNIDIEEIERIIRSVHENQHIIDEEDDDEEEDIIVQEQVPVTPTKGTAAKSFETPQKSENISNELLDSPLKEYIVDEEEEISEVNLSSEGIVNDDVNDENSKDALKSDEEEEEEDDLNVDLSKTIKRGEFPKILFPKWDDSDEEDLYEEDDDFYFEGKEPVHTDKSYKDSLQSIETFVRQNTSFAINLFVKIADEILDESTERIVGLKNDSSS